MHCMWWSEWPSASWRPPKLAVFVLHVHSLACLSTSPDPVFVCHQSLRASLHGAFYLVNRRVMPNSFYQSFGGLLFLPYKPYPFSNLCGLLLPLLCHASMRAYITLLPLMTGGGGGGTDVLFSLSFSALRIFFVFSSRLHVALATCTVPLFLLFLRQLRR